MITAELRIGNYVLFNGSINKIASIHADNTIRLINEKDKEHGCYNIFLVEPIPLTEEWLLKFGFSFAFKDTKGCFLDDTEKYMIHEDVNEWDIFILGHNEDSYICSVKYVHQLQNLFFALIGEEL